MQAKKKDDQEFLMTLTRKPTKRSTRRTTRRSRHTTLGARQIVGRIDAMMRELEMMVAN
jgi:hypothetical protein